MTRRAKHGNREAVFAFDPRNFHSRAWHPALRRAGLRAIRIHDARHTSASHLIADGVDVVEVASILGHSNPTVTLTVYAHALKERHAGAPSLEYPFHDRTVIVTQCGRLCFGGRKINLSQVFAGQAVGVREVAEHIWLISFMHYDLGFFDDQCTRVECAPNPFSAKVSAMSPV